MCRKKRFSYVVSWLVEKKVFSQYEFTESFVTQTYMKSKSGNIESKIYWFYVNLSETKILKFPHCRFHNPNFFGHKNTKSCGSKSMSFWPSFPLFLFPLQLLLNFELYWNPHPWIYKRHLGLKSDMNLECRMLLTHKS